MTNLEMPLGQARARGWRNQIYARYGKRMFDLILIAPIFFCLVIALIVILPLNPFLNPGPLFYTQARIGRGGRQFRVLKFRSMTKDGPISRAAQFMRRTRVDELPQIWCVLKGDMSLIGPRPEQPELSKFYAQKIQGYERRYDIRPGVTGLAQLMEGYTDDVTGAQKKLVWDRVYIEGQSFALDLKITWMTMRVVFAHLLHIPIQTKL